MYNEKKALLIIRSKAVTGFLIIPGLVTALFMLWGYLLQPSLSYSFKEFQFLLVFAYPTSLTVGIPAYLILKRFSLNKLWHYTIAGIICGLLVSWAFWIFDLFEGGLAFHYYRNISFAMFGAFGSSIFWRLVIRTLGQNESMSD